MVQGGGGDRYRISPAYVTFSDDLYGQIMLSIEAADPELGHTMCFMEVGNHGGGPTKVTSSTSSRTPRLSPMPNCNSSTPQAFFDAVSKRRELSRS